MGVTASSVFGIIGMVGMVGSVTASGVNSAIISNNIRKQIDAINQQNEDWKNKYTDIMNANYVLDEKMLKATRDALDNYLKLQAQINITIDSYSKQYRSIQINGIIFVTIIFFLLIFKQFGLSEPLFEFLTYPIKWAWNVIFKKT